jgi:hypothetical protein
VNVVIFCVRVDRGQALSAPYRHLRDADYEGLAGNGDDMRLFKAG